MKKFFLVRLNLGSLVFYLLLAMVWFFTFLFVNSLVLGKPFVISTNQDYFIQAEKTWLINFTSLELPGYYDLFFSLALGLLTYGFSKLKFLEKHNLIILVAINTIAWLVGVVCSFYFGAIFFGVVAYLAFIVIYLLIILSLEILNLLEAIVFPD